MALIHNERTKLLANSLDRLSTAAVAAGFIAPVASLTATGSLSGITLSIVISTMAWISAALILHLVARQSLGRLRPLTFAVAFYLYILPLAISFAGIAWMVFDSWRDRRKKRLNPGERLN